MKTHKLLFAFTFVLVSFITSTAQTPDLSSLIEDAKKNAIVTAKSDYLEFVSDWKRAVVKPGGKTYSQTYEFICSNRHCENIQVEEDGKYFSEKKIEKNRKKAAKNFVKSELTPTNASIKIIDGQNGYYFRIATTFNPKINSSFSPYMYLKTCKTEFLEKKLIENRPTVKFRAFDCHIDSEPKKEFLSFMPKTEAIIWIDEADKTVVKTEVYGKQESETTVNLNKPLVIMETAKVPQGSWFWKKITINANDNQYFFPSEFGNWQIDFFNYKKFNVDINKAEIDEKTN